jgi:hypothetical protein
MKAYTTLPSRFKSKLGNSQNHHDFSRDQNIINTF